MAKYTFSRTYIMEMTMTNNTLIYSREMILHHLDIQLFTTLSMWQGGPILYFIF